jgi:hypothetical protein
MSLALRGSPPGTRRSWASVGERPGAQGSARRLTPRLGALNRCDIFSRREVCSTGVWRDNYTIPCRSRVRLSVPSLLVLQSEGGDEVSADALALHSCQDP